METIKKIIKRSELSSLTVPDSFGDEIEIIIFPHNPINETVLQEELTEEEDYFIRNARQIIEDSEEEDQIWRKYL
jgi:hypothetical protein